ncbi:GNAT family N-acyltransferase [Roseinatronobacter sp. S2]|uniref:GNAT family N-acyltransferase n=1 Tax=Roseinatronobacter sp. S2 TaxID=3035471 RepID=UPI00241078CA|nr:GNAT family N-acyltransferase [Roseinatronobacter sp. S2]WFE73884.1 GNAT family N-acyltransferase [Roseinatronobacter sp. S2]
MTPLRTSVDSLADFPPALTGAGLVIGGFPVRFAQTASDIAQVQRLRHDRFQGAGARQSDTDRFDSLCAHLMVFSPDGGRLLASARLRLVSQHTDVSATYTGQFYDLSALLRKYMRALEIGRLCQVADADDMPDALRALLAAVTLISVQTGVELLFGCTSFRGQDMQRHQAALTWLRARHTGPAALRPPRIHPRASALPDGDADPQAARQALPALLRMYLGMGGWVSDHAVVDPELDTVHVFTAVATATIPPARSRALRALCPV